MATTYTFKVDGDNPAEKCSYRNSSTLQTGQLTGSSWRFLHHEVNTPHLRAYSFLVEGDLEWNMVSITSVERPHRAVYIPPEDRLSVKMGKAVLIKDKLWWHGTSKLWSRKQVPCSCSRAAVVSAYQKWHIMNIHACDRQTPNTKNACWRHRS